MAKNVIDILIKATNQTKKGLTEPITDLNSLQSAAGKIGPAFTAASVAAVAGLAVMVKSSIDVADNFSKMAARTGETTEYLSTLAHAAELSGTSMEGIEKGLVYLNGLMQDAADGTKTAQLAFQRLGIEYQNSDGTMRKSSDLMAEIADKMAGMEDGSQKNAIAAELFGKKIGTQMIPMLNGGAAGLRDMQQEARDLGLEIDGGAAAAAEKFNDDLDRVAKVSKGFANQLMGEVVPGLTVLSEQFAASAKEGGVMESVAWGIGQVFRGVVAAGDGVVFVIKSIAGGLGALAAAAVAAATGDFSGAKAALSSFADDTGNEFDKMAERWAQIFSDPKPVNQAKANTDGLRVINIKAIEETEAAKQKAHEAEKKRQEEQREAARSFAEEVQNKWNNLHLSKLEAIDLEMQKDLERLETLTMTEADRALNRQLIEENAAEQQRLYWAEEDARYLREEEQEAEAHEKAKQRADELDQKMRDDHAKRVKEIRDLIDMGGSMTSGLVAGMETFTDSSVAGSKKISTALENTWLAYREALKRALIYKASQMAIDFAANIIAAKLAGTALAAAWAPAATAATIATLGGAAAQAPLSIAGSTAATSGVLLAGVAHDGLDRVNKTGTYLLKEGEMVMNPRQAESVRQRYADGEGRGPVSVTLMLNGRELGKAVSELGDEGRITLPTKVIRG